MQEQSAKDQVAVIIPVYNVTRFMEEAVRSAATQDYPEKDVIVVDDGSCAEAAQEIQRISGLFPGVTLVRQHHAGAMAARLCGVSASTAELIVFLDADDVLLPGALGYLAAALQEEPDAVAAYAKMHYIDESGNIAQGKHIQAEPATHEILPRLLERFFSLCIGAVCIRRKALEQLSLRDLTMRYGENWILWCRLALLGDIILAGNRAVLHYRRHDDSISTAMADDYSLVIETYDKVYEDPAFVAALGRETMVALKKKHTCRFHMELAGFYTRIMQPEKAAYHWKQIDMPLSALF